MVGAVRASRHGRCNAGLSSWSAQPWPLVMVDAGRPSTVYDPNANRRRNVSGPSVSAAKPIPESEEILLVSNLMFL
jgi:hypothetical protein